MLRCTPLPLSLSLGQSSRNINQKNFHKSHHFDISNKVQILAEAVRPGIGGNPLFDNEAPQYVAPSLYPSQQGPLTPAWLLYDQKVLCFFGYFKETLPEVHRAPYQVRKVKIFYYLEDGTIQVSEPKCVNSGISQGCLISRQRVPMPPPNQHDFVSVLDLNVNQTARLFDRVYVITGCDIATRNFLNRQGIAVSDPIEIPKDPSTELRKSQESSMQPRKPFTRVDTLGKFLKNDRKVLRFEGFWDDTNCENGDIRHLEVLYHLSNDTIEIKEKLPENSGRDSNGMFLKRMKLPKEGTQMPRIGTQSFTILNVLGKGLKGGRYLQDCLDVSSNDVQFYQEKDLSIGRVLNVYGRIVTLTDCDEFTKSYYRQKYGIEEFHSIIIPSRSQKFYNNDRVLPPFNGWGSHEDSEANCKSVELKAPHVDFKKFINYDKVVLRFGAKMTSKIRENNDRVFVINYYLSDDTLSVHELARRNSGFLGGEFFKRAKFVLPDQGWYTSSRPKIYLSHHFFLGSKVILRDYFFEIISADIFALNFMEQHKEDYPMSHPTMILSKVRDHLKPIYKDFIARYLSKVKTRKTDEGLDEMIAYPDFKNLLIELFGDDIVEQEIVTLCRFFSMQIHRDPQVHRETMRSLIHQEIYRNIWDDLTCLKEFIYHLDPEKHEYLPEKTLRTVLRGSRVPLDISLIEQFFAVLKRDGCDEIEVKDFLDFLDLRGHKSVPTPPIYVKKHIFGFEVFDQNGSIVDWKKFIRVLDLETDLQQAGN